MSMPTFPGLNTAEGVDFVWSYLLAHQNVAGLQLDQRAMDFLAYCLPRFHASKAQLFQDLYVAYKLKGKREGFFVEFGATDGMSLSNTYMLEKQYSWLGILAEPFPVWHEQLHGNRNAVIDHRCVWTESGKQIEFVAANQYPELASMQAYAENDHHAPNRLVNAETILVETVSLNDMLEGHRAPAFIDYISIDVEGAEFDVLQKFDFNRHRVRVFTIEHNYQDGPRNLIKQHLEAHGYRREFELFSKWDDWYFHPDLV